MNKDSSTHSKHRVDKNRNVQPYQQETRNGHVVTKNDEPTSTTSKVDVNVNYLGRGEDWDDSVPIPRLTFVHSALLVFSLAVLCFANSYDGDFVFDDHEAIITNDDLLPTAPLTQLFRNDFWGNKLASSTSHKSYRPLTVLTFRWNYFIAGGLHPLGFHVANILLHAIVSTLLLPVFSVIIGEGPTNSAGCWQFKAPRASLLSVILFAVHPIHTESVAGIVGRADLLCALLFLTSFLCYAKACHTGGASGSVRPDEFSLPWLMTSMLLCAFSVLCKEQGITVIGVCSAYDVIIICRINIFTMFTRRPESGKSNGQSKPGPRWLRSILYRQACLLLTGVVLLVVRWRVMGSATPTFQLVDNPHSFTNGTLIRAINYNYLYSMNSWLLINPWWLCFDWSMGCIPVITSLTDSRILSPIAFWVVLGFLIYTCWKDEISKNERLLLMGLAFLVVPFLPASNLLFRVGFVIAERVLYLSTAGYCILVTLGIHSLCRHFTSYIPVFRLVITVLVSVLILRCVQRSSEWRTELSLFDSGEKVCPLNAKVHYNIAKLSADRGNIDYAIAKYRLAIELNPRYDQAMNNLGNILKDWDLNEEAEQLLRRAVEVSPEFAAAWMNLGIVLASLNQPGEAERCYFTALKHRRKYPDCYYNLGNLYLNLKRHTDALLAFRNATIQTPTHVNSWNNMMLLLANLGRHSEAEMVGKEALHHLPDHMNIHFNLANSYGQADKYSQSEFHFLKALQQDDRYPGIYANLGVLYHRWEKFDKAEKAYKRAIELEPDKTGPGSSRDNLQMLHRKMGKGL